MHKNIKNRTTIITLCSLAAMVLLSGCQGKQVVNVAIDDAQVQKEQKLQSKLALNEYLKNLQRAVFIGNELLAASLPLCTKEHTITSGLIITRWAQNEGENKQVLAQREKHLIVYEPYGAIPVANVIDKLIHQGAAHTGDAIIHAIDPNSPAATSGLQVGDKVMRLNDEDYEYTEGKQFLLTNKDDVHQYLPSIRAGLNVFTVERDGVWHTFDVATQEICAFPISIIIDNEIQAFTDGYNVMIHTGFLNVLADRFIRSVLAHEIAHNVLDHIEAKQGRATIGLALDVLVQIYTGVDINARNIAALLFSQEEEKSADYTGMYIYARSGYDIDEVIPMWRLMAIKLPTEIGPDRNYFSSHPSFAERFVAMKETINEIHAKRAAGEELEELLPNFSQ